MKLALLSQAAEQLYQTLTQGDRPIQPQPERKPWLAALLSTLVIGGGQLYNRQLDKAVWYFVAAYLPTSIVLLIYLLLRFTVDPETSPSWLVTTAEIFRLAIFIVPFIYCLLWLFAVMDAYRTAVMLRDGQLEVRYGLKRQAVHLAVGFVPGVGNLVPDATVASNTPRPSLADLVKQEVRQRVIKRIITRLLGFGCMALIMFLLLVGVLIGAAIMISAGGPGTK